MPATDPGLWWFSSLLDELRTRNSRAHASLLSPAALPLRRFVERALDGPAESLDTLLATPVFEHKFGFRQAAPTMGELVPDVLHERLVANMDRPPPEFREQRFERGWRPYTHQLEAWQALKSDDTSSIVVSAGTGAGKTECFLVPILDHLAREEARVKTELVGVQALFLYPLNALINSQRERLSAWTAGFEGRIRYCLYNGETAETVPASEQARHPERVLSRKLLRERPPPLLITNATMLEYMLVRPEDQPILARSQGRLRFVVIDEAHTYVGSMAAELALLLRRVTNAFGVDPKDVRFFATSATLGSADKVEQMRRFLADVAGQEPARVAVITDRREIHMIPSPPLVGDVPDLDALDAQTPRERFDVMCAHRAPRLLREWLVTDGAQTVRALRRRLEAAGIPLSARDVVRLLDGCKAAKPDRDEAFLPLRGHAFVRGMQGLWACVDPACPGRGGTVLDDEQWPFGAVYTARRLRCAHPACEGMVLELVLCQQCGFEGLICLDEIERIGQVDYDDVIRPPLETDDIETGDDEGEDGSSDDDDDRWPKVDQARILTRPFGEERRSRQLQPRIGVDPRTGTLDVEPPAPELALNAPKDGRFQCPHCGHTGRDDRLSFRSCRTGRTFVLGVSVPVLLEHLPPHGEPGKLPFDGRRTITFTDSRQGTARFAAQAQGESERNYVRSFVYHSVIAAQRVAPARLVELRQRVANLEAAMAQLSEPSLLEGALRSARAELQAARGVVPVRLVDLASQLASAPRFRALDRYWRDYLPFADAGIDAATLAKWLILREFARRPMRAPSLETLGLVAMRLPAVGGGKRPPELWRRRVAAAGADPEAAWADLLKLLLDFFVRSNAAVQIDDRFFRWVGTAIRPKVVLPGKPPIRNQRVAWPRFGPRTRPRLAWLVVRALGLDGRDPETRARVNDVLDEAWEHIRPALRTAEGGYRISMDDVLLEPVARAHVCPMTRMLLDTTLLGHTPYQPPLDRRFDTRCREVRMPWVPSPFWLEGDPRVWIAHDPAVCEARARGGLSEFAERVLVSSPYFQVAEHSAQLQSTTLQKAERQFKEGRLNLLSCSTTMEMGVDIGNLAGVAMNNVPPSPANFLQRVGRAGRRGESAAVSLTVCRHLPHDQAVFAEPDWPFRTPIHITPVKLDSQRIVERHVRAAALTRFLQPLTDTAIPRLTCVWFFVPGEGQTAAPVDHLVEWLETVEEPQLFAQLERLVRESSLHGIPGRSLLKSAVEPFEEVAARFRALRAAILAQMEGLTEGEVPWLALWRQLRRLDEDYLLGYLASEQVLLPPGGAQPPILSPAFLDALRLGPDLQVFGERTEVQWGEPRIGLLRQVRRSVGAGPGTVQLFVHGDPDGWDPVTWAGRRLVRQLRELPGVRVRLMLPAPPEGLGWQLRRQLAALAESEGVELAVGTGDVGPVALWAAVDDGQRTAGFATAPARAPFSADWVRRANGAIFVKGPLGAMPAPGRAVDPAALVGEPEPGVVVVDLRPTAGPARGFGERFWAALDNGCAGLLDALRPLGPADRIEVRDRYLVTPLVAHALFAVVDQLRRLGGIGPATRVAVHTQASRNERSPGRLGHNWRHEGDQRAVLEGLLRSVAPDVEVVLTQPRDGRRLPHHRSLTLTWPDSAWEIRLDAGFGYLTAGRDDRFRFDAAPDAQVSRLLQAAWTLRTPGHEVPAYVIRGT